ncbi:hypothetical protein CPC08DRAFT_818349 [Agrocybe pediades]|nr:hypothetical protein CPC08DRAFT_818349 [Agrocybe pediades]
MTEAKLAANWAHSTFLKTLPNEIVSIIFFMALEDVRHTSLLKRQYIRQSQEPRQNRLLIAHLLSSVCKKWRHIAVSLPRLWADIDVFLHRQHGNDALSIFRNIIKRSKNAPLTIRLYFEPEDGNTYSYSTITMNQLQPALTILQEESERWQSLKMSVPLKIISDLLRPRMNLSGVRSLYVQSGNQDFHDIGLVSPAENNGLQPRHVSFDNLTMKNIDIIWNRVTYISARHFTTLQAMKVVRSAPLLTHLKLKSVDEHPDPALSTYLPDFIHSNLRHIMYEGVDCSVGGAKTIFSFNIFPALTRVEFYNRAAYTGPGADQDTLTCNILRHSPPLKEMKLYISRPYRPHYLMSVLEAVSPTLTLLEFGPLDGYYRSWSVCNYTPLFKRFATVDNHQKFLPCLKGLIFSSTKLFERWDLVPKFFASHDQQRQRPLKQFIFFIIPTAANNLSGDDIFVPKKVLYQLGRLQRSGFHVHYRSRNRAGTNLLQESIKFHNLSRVASQTEAQAAQLAAPINIPASVS